AELFDQIEADVDRRIDTAAAEQAIVLGDELIGAPEDLWIARGQVLAKRPMGGGEAPVEKPRLGEIGRAHADAYQIGALAVVHPQPWEQAAVLHEPDVEID